MIKAAGKTGDGTPLLLIGLSAEDIKQLQQGRATEFTTAPLGLPVMRIVVAAGQAGSDILDKMRDQDLTR